MGKPMDVISKDFFHFIPDRKRPFIAAMCFEYECEYLSIHGGRLYPGLVETLETLRRHYHLSIVSNCQKGYIEAFTVAHSLSEYFSDTECWGRTQLSKSENIKQVVERNKLVHAVYVGDTDSDRIASKDSGVEFIYASYGFGDVHDAKYSISAIAELPQMIDGILPESVRTLDE